MSETMLLLELLRLEEEQPSVYGWAELELPPATSASLAEIS